MSSARFPGKVLAPFRGKPIIGHVIAGVERAISKSDIVLATSDLPSDDPLAVYAQSRGISVFRGALENVFLRFRDCLREFPCDWFFRVCADSPLLDSAVIQKMAGYSSRTDLDLVTNVFPRTFPRGQSAEMILAETFLKIDAEDLSGEEKEHVTKHFYQNPEDYRILNVVSGRKTSGSESVAVDTLEDLLRLERMPGVES